MASTSSIPQNKRQKMSETQAVDEIMPFNYKQLDIIGTGIYELCYNKVWMIADAWEGLTKDSRLPRDVAYAARRALLTNYNLTYCRYLRFNDRIEFRSEGK